MLGFAGRVIWVWFGLLSLGCNDSGQTGSASCAGPCQCEYLADFHLAKATVLAVHRDEITIRVDQLLNEAPGDAQYEQQELSGTFEPHAFCTPAQLELPTVGDDVFASFTVSDSADAREVLLRVQPWADEIRLGDDSLVSLADAVDLSDASTCYARYAAPCNDTPSGGGGCAVSAPGSRVGAAPGFAVTALILCCFARLRRRRR